MKAQSTFSLEKTKLFSAEIRKRTLEMVYKAKASHIGGAFSMVDILAVLYSNILNIDPHKPNWEQRDRFLLSKGHACTSLYVTLALSEFFSVELLNEYGTNGTLLLSHTSNKIQGVELSTGSLGHALPFGCGLALASKRNEKYFNTYVLVGDGELNEGSNWESILFAPQHKLDSLVLIVDYNKIQSFGRTNDVINQEPIVDRWKSFGWDVFEVDGHNFTELYDAFQQSHTKPKVIIAHTVKGKGVSFMENKLEWHYKSPNQEQYDLALDEIDNQI